MKIAVLGDGGWGTALAILLSERGNDVFLWSNFPEYVDVLKSKRENIKFLPGIAIPEPVLIESNIDRCENAA